MAPTTRAMAARILAQQLTGGENSDVVCLAASADIQNQGHRRGSFNPIVGHSKKTPAKKTAGKIFKTKPASKPPTISRSTATTANPAKKPKPTQVCFLESFQKVNQINRNNSFQQLEPDPEITAEIHPEPPAAGMDLNHNDFTEAVAVAWGLRDEGDAADPTCACENLIALPIGNLLFDVGTNDFENEVLLEVEGDNGNLAVVENPSGNRSSLLEAFFAEEDPANLNPTEVALMTELLEDLNQKQQRKRKRAA